MDLPPSDDFYVETVTSSGSDLASSPNEPPPHHHDGLFAVATATSTGPSSRLFVDQDWGRLQEQTLERKRRFLEQVHELECAMASLHAKIATERMERNHTVANVLQDGVRKPIEALMEKISLQQDLDTQGRSKRSWMHLEKRLSKLDTNATLALYRTLPEQLREINVLRDQVERELLQQHTTHVRKGNDASLVRNMDYQAGSMARKYQQERASRIAALQMASEHLKEEKELDEQRAETFLQQIQELRHLVQQERAHRIAADAKLQQQIAMATTKLKRSLLQVAEDEDGTSEIRLLKQY